MPGVPPIISSITPRSAAPVQPQERIELLDVLRGFSLFGILLVNMALFSWPAYYLFAGMRPGALAVDQWADWLVQFFAAGKFYPLFSFLFGVGIAMQLLRSEARGVSFVRPHLKRMLVLLVIGIFHAFFIWEGDILMVYALFGIALMAFWKRKPITLGIWTAVCLLLPIVLYGAIGGIWYLASILPSGGEGIQSQIELWYAEQYLIGERNMEIFANGSFGEILVQRAQNVLFINSLGFLMFPVVLAMFLVGIYVGRRGYLQNVQEHLTLFKRLFVIGLCLAIPGNLLLVIAHEKGITMESYTWPIVEVIAISLAAPLLTLAYITGIVLLSQREVWRKRFAVLAPVGRMALTNYLLQSILCTTIFYSYGLGLYGSVGRAAGVVLAIFIFILQIPLSHWWLRRFRFGPAEWLWRSLTYGRMPLTEVKTQPLP